MNKQVLKQFFQQNDIEAAVKQFANREMEFKKTGKMAF